MKPIDFPQSMVVLAKDQPEYQPLPIAVRGSENISCWELSWKERMMLLFTGKLWLRQMNFGQVFQPQFPQVENPFV